MTEDSMVRVARDLTTIETHHHRLLTQAVHKANDPDMPGGPAMVALGHVGNQEAWEHRVEGAEAWNTNNADRPEKHIDLSHVEDEDDLDAPALQTLTYWSERWRRAHGAEYDQRPSITTEANFIRWSLDWAHDNEPNWDAFVKDIAKARARLEGILYAGVRAERGVPCMYDECKGVRLVRKLVPKGDGNGQKTWVHSDWHCPRCHRKWDDDAYWRNVRAANERAQREDIGGETWVSVDYAARETGRPVKTIRTWVNRGLVATVCVIVGRRNRFVNLADVRARHNRKDAA